MLKTPVYKAQGFNSLAVALKDMCGASGWQRFESESKRDPELHGVVVTPPPASTWLPLRLETAFHDLASEVCFAGDLTKSYELGHRSATIDFKGVYRTFIKLLSVEFLSARTGLIWSMYYKHNGEVTSRFDPKTKGTGDVSFNGIAFPSPTTWENYRGGIAAMLELTRVKDLSITIAEGGGAEHSARFHLTWIAR